jgi:molybdenum cofactor cytidylyltransferase
VILLGDQPDMTAGLIDVMVRAWNETKPLAARAYFGGAPGHPVVVSRSLWKEVASQSGDRGAAGLMDSLGPGVVEVHVGNQPLQDVDTWEQYEELCHGD